MARPSGEPGEMEGEAHGAEVNRWGGVKTPPCPPARHVAMAAAALWLLVPCALAVTSSPVVLSLVVIAPLIAATAADERRTAIVAVATVSLTLADGFWHGQTEGANSWVPLTAACAVSVPAVVLAGVRRRREEHLARMTAIARTAQVALLPPVPRRSRESASRPATDRRHRMPRSAVISRRSSPPDTASG